MSRSLPPRRGTTRERESESAGGGGRRAGRGWEGEAATSLPLSERGIGVLFLKRLSVRTKPNARGGP